MLKILGSALLIALSTSNSLKGQASNPPLNPRAACVQSTVLNTSSVAPYGPVLRVEGNRFVDSTGRVILLRGVNISGGAKIPPFLTVRSISDLDPLPSFGFNVIRLVFIWEAFEPTPGDYNLTYLATIRQIADAAWSRGLFVIIDIHQDGFSRFTSRGAGDGFPSWAVSKSVKMSEPDNGQASKFWPALVATSAGMHRSFSDFYNDANGIRTRYLAMLDRLSREFSGSPGVVGYDLLNEAWGRERQQLGPLYHDAAHVIRAHHPAAIMFIEGHISTNLGLQTKLDRPTFGNVAYAPHFYDPVTMVRHGWRGRPVVINYAFHNMKAKADEWDVPLFLGEFGVPPSARLSNQYIATINDHLDQALASGAQWNYTPTWNDRDKDGWNVEDFNILDPNGRPRSNFEARPYPRATAGVPLYYEFQKASKSSPVHTLEYIWRHDPSLGPTELYLPRSLFSPTSTSYLTNVSDIRLSLNHELQILYCNSPRPQMIHLTLRSPSQF